MWEVGTTLRLCPLCSHDAEARRITLRHLNPPDCSCRFILWTALDFAERAFAPLSLGREEEPMISSSNVMMTAAHNYGLVTLSVLIGMFASYTALDLSGRVTSTRGWISSAWLAGGALVMGIGIWSMHFTGMLAFSLPVRVAYDWPTVLMALLVAIFASAVALYTVSRPKIGLVHVLTASVIVGIGIAALHYIVMAAMRLPADCRFNALLVSTSVLLAIVFSFPPLWLVLQFPEQTMGTARRKITSAVALGAAISVMHYTGTASASFMPSTVPPDLSHAVSISWLGTAGIIFVTLIVQALAVFTSFLDRQVAAQALELQASDRFRQLADSLRDVLALTSTDFSEVLYVNRAYEEVWGRTTESLYAAPASWLEGVHPDDREQVKDAMQRLLRAEPLDSLEHRVVRPDGSISWVASRGYPVRDARGHPYRLAGIVQDITQRKRAEEEHRKLGLIVENSPDFICIADPNQKVIFVNRSGQRMLGLDGEEEVRRTSILDYFAEQDCGKVKNEVIPSLLETGDWEGEMRYRHFKTGVLIPFWLKIFPIRDPKTGAPAFYACVSRNITERKWAEEELQRLSGSLLRLQDEERRSIARDLHDSTGQDLIALATTLGQLHASIPSSSRKVRKLVSGCQAVADQCIREVRTVSYLLHPPMLDETGLEDAIRHYVDGFAKRSGIQVELEVSPRFGRISQNAELTLFRVVQESLTNIQRHSGSRKALIRLARNSEKITLEVRDKGRGIPGSPRTQTGALPPGVGVGIPSMHERAKQIGGRLDIESRSSGTTVRVTIPADVEGHRETSHPRG
jgi:PAS domain S-box-containing protein